MPADTPVAVIRAGMDNALRNMTSTAGRAPAGGAVAKIVSPALGDIKVYIARAEQMVTEGATKAWNLAQGDRPDPAAVNAAIAATRATAEAELTLARTGTARLTEALRKLSLPQRPTTVDEGALSGLKEDLRMVTDSLTADDVPTFLLDELQRRQIAGDALGVWLLGASDWPRLLLSSRGVTEMALYDGLVPGVLAAGAPDEDLEAARSILRALEAPSGLAGALVSLSTIVRWRLDDLAAYRWGQLDIGAAS